MILLALQCQIPENGASVDHTDFHMNHFSMDIKETLRSTRLLHGIAESHLHKLEKLAVEQHYSDGTVLFAENTLHRTFYLIVDGAVSLDIHVPRRGVVRVLTVGPGEILAWSAILGDGRMTTSATTTTPTRVIAWPADQLLALCQQDHEIGFVFMQRIAQALSRRLTATRLQLLDMFAETEPLPRPSSSISPSP
jgi:CRP/FNR family cyclic AMP-dependent transcriptional regulator